MGSIVGTVGIKVLPTLGTPSKTDCFNRQLLQWVNHSDFDPHRQSAPFAILGGHRAATGLDSAFGDGEAEAAAAGVAATGGFGAEKGFEKA